MFRKQNTNHSTPTNDNSGLTTQNSRPSIVVAPTWSLFPADKQVDFKPVQTDAKSNPLIFGKGTCFSK